MLRMENHILPTLPNPTPATFVFGSPRWLVLSFRCFLFFVGFIAAVLATQHWLAMPLFARFLAVFVAPALLAGSMWPRPWQYSTRFIANENGLYFPAYPPLTLSRGTPQFEVEWLAVPWKHISNIRLATESGEDGKCVAFDMQASADEKAKFFEAVGIPRDRGEQSAADVFAAYGGWPPSPAQAVKKLLDLSSRATNPASAH